MNWGVWAQVEKALLEFQVNPILAVVPDNQDKVLNVCDANKNFWNEVRTWQQRGWTIGVHGYQHRFVTRDAGIVGINEFSEFSGLAYEEQSYNLRCALEIFEREGVKPEVWIAPGHSFDKTTVKALRFSGIKYISDGLYLFPWLDPLGVLWVPQQFWKFRWMPLGVWTVCQHFNSWTANDISKLRSDLKRFRPRIVDFRDVVNLYAERHRCWFDASYARLHLAALKASLMRRGRVSFERTQTKR